MATHTLNTRIQSKIASLNEWLAVEKTFKPLKGEICIATVPTQEGSTLEPVMIKVGDGTNFWGSLDWVSAKAADVYGWAKEATKPTYQATEIQGLEAYIGEKIQDTDNNTTYAFELKEGKLVITATPHVLGVAGDAVEVASLDIVTPEELATALEPYAKTEDVNSALSTARSEISAEIDADVKALKDGDVKANADAIAAIKDDADLDSFADVKAALAGKQDTIPANTYDTYGAAADALDDAKEYVDNKFTTANLDQYTTEQEVKDIVDAVIVGAVEGDTLEGLVDLVNYINEHGGEAAEMAKAIEALEQKPGLDKTGTVTSIAAGDGLDGGTITETGTISLNATTKASLAKADTALQAADIVTGNANGTIAVDGTDVAVKGLGSAAYTNTDAYATAAQGAKADTAVQSGSSNSDRLTLTKDENNNLVVGITDAFANELTAKVTASDFAKGDTAGTFKIDHTAVEVNVADIAKTGNVNDLIQTSGDVLILNCGTSNTVI